jgi:transcription factor MBP1
MHVVEEQMETASVANHIDGSTPDNASIAESRLEDETYGSQYTNSRKRKREDERMDEIWADALLDYFMLADSEQRLPAPPSPPPGIDLDRAIDDKGHTALHWAAAMGDVDIVKDLLNRGARVDVLSKSMETPLMRAVMFTNNYDRSSMGKLVRLLQSTVQGTDWFGSTVFHHIAATTSSKNKYLPARYYLDTVINTLAETWVPADITRLLNARDNNGDAAIHIAARHGARKCVRSLLGRNVSLDVPNSRGETADEMIQELNARRLRHAGARGRDASSSPFGPDRVPLNGSGDAHLPIGMASSHPPPTAGSLTAGPAEYQSQTASALMARVAPAFLAKCRGLASAFEAEYQDKLAEARACEVTLRKRTAEVDVLRRQAAELRAGMDAEVAAHGLTGETWERMEERERAQEEAEIEALEREALSLLEYEQRETLRAAMAKLGTGPGAEAMDYETAAAAMRAAQAERQRLTRDIVSSLGVAGLGERVAEYKRLIHGALNVPEDALEEALDEILAQLEEEKKERMLLDEVA